MNIEEIILKTAGLVGAVAVIWKFVVPIYQRVRKKILAEEELGQRIEIALKQINCKIDDVNDRVKLNQRSITKLELLSLIRNEPERAETIENLFIQYRELGGNSYVCEVMEAWREIYEEPVIKKRIKKKT